MLVYPQFSYFPGKQHLFTDGRPRALSDIPISTYGALVATIQPHQALARKKLLRSVMWLLLPMLVISWTLPLSEELVVEDWGISPETFAVVSIFVLYGWFFVYIVALITLTRSHVRNILNPGVEDAIQEMQTQFGEAGFRVEYVSEQPCCKNKCYLKFTPLGNGSVSLDADDKGVPLI